MPAGWSTGSDAVADADVVLDRLGEVLDRLAEVVDRLAEVTLDREVEGVVAEVAELVAELVAEVAELVADVGAGVEPAVEVPLLPAALVGVRGSSRIDSTAAADPASTTAATPASSQARDRRRAGAARRSGTARAGPAPARSGSRGASARSPPPPARTAGSTARTGTGIATVWSDALRPAPGTGPATRRSSGRSERESSRWVGSLASRPVRAGASGPASRTGGGSAVSTAVSVCRVPSRWKGDTPSAAIHSVMPSDHR